MELVKTGVDIRAVHKVLGHSSLATTEKYYAPWNKARQDIHNDTIRSARKKMTAYAFLRCTCCCCPAAYLHQPLDHYTLTEANGLTISPDCNLVSRLDNLRDDSEPVSRFEEHSFNIGQLDVDRRVVKRPVVHWTS